ncbi:YciI family protein [Halomonas cupida]|uniref:YciI family protein n=1 Tax=Halomonas cupida TaxID=44933 RepID=UPI0039B6C4C3
MFIISLTYKRDISEVEPHMAAHMEYIDHYYAAGVFVASGRKVPRTGGVILAVAESREALEAIVARDPFCIHHLVEVEIIEFAPSRTSPELTALLP